MMALLCSIRQADAFASLAARPASSSSSSSSGGGGGIISSRSSNFNAAGLHRTTRVVAPRSMASRPWPSMSAGLPGDSSGLSSAATQAFADLRERLIGPSLSEAAQSQLQQLSLPKVKLLEDLLSSSSLKPPGMPTLPDLSDWLTAASSSAGQQPSTSEVFSRLLSLAEQAGLGDLTLVTRAWVEAAASGLPLTPEKFTQLMDVATQASERASSRVALSLDALVAENPSLAPPVGHLESSFGHALAAAEQAYAAGASAIPEEFHPMVVTLAIGAASTALGFSLAAAWDKEGEEEIKKNAPLPRDYDLPAIMDYYNRRPLTLFGRLLEVSYRLGSLGGKLWLDKNAGGGEGWERNMGARAEEFVEFLQGAGPAFIKIGQGVSIRPDILPEAYLRELTKLQDRVRAFCRVMRLLMDT